MASTFYTTTFPYRILPVLLLVGAMIAGCSSPPKYTNAASGGGYYMDDGPGSDIPPGIESTPDAVPRIERHNPANFRPYTVMGQRFVPVSAETPLRQKGVASWYGRKFHGKKTANGEIYNMYAMTAAHPTLPLPSYARVTHVKSGRSVIVRVNDRGPFLRGRVIDLSYAAAAKLGIIGRGSDVVEVEAITHAQIRNGVQYASAKRAPASAAVAAAPPPAPVAAPATAPPAAAQSQPPAITVAVTAPAAQAPAPSPRETAAAPMPPATPAGGDTGAGIEVASVTPDALAVLEPSARRLQHAPAQTPPPTVTESPAEGIYLQFGAFSSYISADQLANRLNREIAQVESRSVHIDSGNALHRVRLGPYPTRTAAVNAAVRIQEATGMQPALAQR